MGDIPVLRDALDGAGRVRTLSRADDEMVGHVNLPEVLGSCLRMAENEIRHRARVTTAFDGVPPVRGNPSRMGQVFLNLLINAAQAIPDGRADEHEIRVAAHATDEFVVVEISDTGCGIPQEDQARIFDPFFSTKPIAVGTGLGLAICNEIVASFGGHISVESVVGKGTTFRVELLPSKAESPCVPIRTEPNTPSARILVIDDEPRIGSSLRLILSDEHDVSYEMRATAALERIGRGERFDVIICDLMMPEMSGVNFYNALTTTRPHLVNRVIFITGGAFSEPARNFLRTVPNRCLEKPFDVGLLRDAMSDLLREHGFAQEV